MGKFPTLTKLGPLRLFSSGMRVKKKPRYFTEVVGGQSFHYLCANKGSFQGSSAIFTLRFGLFIGQVLICWSSIQDRGTLLQNKPHSPHGSKAGQNLNHLRMS